MVICYSMAQPRTNASPISMWFLTGRTGAQMQFGSIRASGLHGQTLSTSGKWMGRSWHKELFPIVIKSHDGLRMSLSDKHISLVCHNNTADFQAWCSEAAQTQTCYVLSFKRCPTTTWGLCPDGLGRCCGLRQQRLMAAKCVEKPTNNLHGASITSSYPNELQT